MLEVSFFGVFIPVTLLWAAAAFVICALLGRLLSRTGFYRFIWHRALFELCVFILIWGAIGAIPYRLAFSGH